MSVDCVLYVFDMFKLVIKYYKRRKNCEFWIYKDVYCMYCYVLFCLFFIIVYNVNDFLWIVLILIICVSIKI